MKKNILIAVGLIVLLAACDRKSFVKKLVGTYTLQKYLFDGRDQTLGFDTTHADWKLQLTDGELYSKTWNEYHFQTDTFYVSDTLGYDSVNMIYVINSDTISAIDTSVISRIETGKWDLINSEEDLQLSNDSTNAGEIYRILDLGKSNLTLRKGNEELYLVK